MLSSWETAEMDLRYFRYMDRMLLSYPMPIFHSFVEPDPSHTLEERVVQWYFFQLDNNRSHDISKKEMKPFKRYVKKKAKPKKCARKFIDYCDLNKDKAISLQELKGCLGVNKEGECYEVNPRQN